MVATKRNPREKVGTPEVKPARCSAPLFSIMAAAALLLTTATSFAQSIVTDKTGYQPGEAVTISGEGWQPEESVALLIGNGSGTKATVEIDVIAGTDGSFVNSAYVLQEIDRNQMLTLVARGDSGAEAMLAFRGGLAPGSLSCTATPFDTARYGITPQQSVICTIKNAIDLSSAQKAGMEPVEVIVKGALGPQPARVLLVSGTNITFQWTAPIDACGTATVAYGPVKVCDPRLGKCATFPSQGNDANSLAISTTSEPAGFAYLDAGLALAPCPPPQLTVTGFPENGAFTQASRISYRIVVKNPAAAGSAPAENVRLTDALPGKGGVLWQTASPSQGWCVNPIANNRLDCSLGSIPAQGSVTVTASSTEMTPLYACQWQPNPAIEATADGGMFATGWSSLTCTVPPAQLKVEKSSSGFALGSKASYTIVVSNPASPGSASAKSVQLTDQLPTLGGLAWTEVTTTQGGCSIASNSLLTCSLGAIVAGSSVTVVVSTPATTPGEACQPQPAAAAVATADASLKAQGKGSLTCLTPMTPSLNIVKSNGETGTTYTVTNTGNVPLANISITDDHGTPEPADDVAVGTIEALAPGASAAVTVKLPAGNSSLLAALGSAGKGGFTVLSLGGESDHPESGIRCSDTTVKGNMGILGSAKMTGDRCSSPGNPYGAVLDDALINQVRADAFNAAAHFAALPVTGSVQAQFPSNGDIKEELTIVGVPGLNVVFLEELTVHADLTFTGPAGARFVVNVSKKLDVLRGKIAVAGQVGPFDLLFNVAHGTSPVTAKIHSDATGIILAPFSAIKTFQESNFYGAMIGGYNKTITLHSGTVTLPPLPATASASNATASAAYGGATVSASTASASIP